MTPRYNYMPNVPAVGTVALVWVWWLFRDVRATWDGAAWRDADGRVLDDVLCWRVDDEPMDETCDICGKHHAKWVTVGKHKQEVWYCGYCRRWRLAAILERLNA